MRYLVPLLLLAGLAGCAGYNDGYAYQTQYPPSYAYNGYPYGYDSYYRQNSATTGFGSCENSPFVWKLCPESPSN
jgi:hypothetical protein